MKFGLAEAISGPGQFFYKQIEKKLLTTTGGACKISFLKPVFESEISSTRPGGAIQKGSKNLKLWSSISFVSEICQVWKLECRHDFAQIFFWRAHFLCTTKIWKVSPKTGRNCDGPYLGQMLGYLRYLFSGTLPTYIPWIVTINIFLHGQV